MTDDPFKKQFGGTHYKGMAIEPFTFGMANRYDSAAFSVMKYVSRHQRKGGPVDLQKAAHIVEIRVQSIRDYGRPYPAMSTIPALEFCEANGLNELETTIILGLHDWCIGHKPAHLSDPGVGAILIEQILSLSKAIYGESK